MGGISGSVLEVGSPDPGFLRFAGVRVTRWMIFSMVSCGLACAVMAETDLIRTPDQRVRVFVSSTLRELATERRAVRDAVASLRLVPVMFELGARPYPPRAACPVTGSADRKRHKPFGPPRTDLASSACAHTDEPH
jgi:Domain of unknown function (DUF4062)